MKKFRQHSGYTDLNEMNVIEFLHLLQGSIIWASVTLIFAQLVRYHIHMIIQGAKEKKAQDRLSQEYYRKAKVRNVETLRQLEDDLRKGKKLGPGDMMAIKLIYQNVKQSDTKFFTDWKNRMMNVIGKEVFGGK